MPTPPQVADDSQSPTPDSGASSSYGPYPDPATVHKTAQTILTPLQVPDSVKADAFNATLTAQSDVELQQRLSQIDIPEGTKASLWEARYPTPRQQPEEEQGFLGKAWDAINSPEMMIRAGTGMTGEQAQKKKEELDRQHLHDVATGKAEPAPEESGPFTKVGMALAGPAFQAYQMLRDAGVHDRASAEEAGRNVAMSATKVMTPLVLASEGLGAYARTGKVGAKAVGRLGKVASAGFGLQAAKGVPDIDWRAVADGNPDALEDALMKFGMISGAAGHVMEGTKVGTAPIQKAPGVLLDQAKGVVLDSPVALMKRAVRPTANKQGARFDTHITNALPELVRWEDKTGQRIEGLEDLQRAASDARKNIYQHIEQNYLQPGAHLSIDGNKVADAMIAKIPDGLRQENPEQAAALERQANSYRHDIPVMEAEDRIQYNNSKLNDYYKRLDASGTPEATLMRAEGVRVMRDLLAQTVDNAVGTADFKGLKAKYGSLRELEMATEKRRVIFDRQAKMPLIERLAILSALGHAVTLGPAGVAAALAEYGGARAISHINNPNTQVRWAIEQYRRKFGSPAPLPVPPPRPGQSPAAPPTAPAPGSPGTPQGPALPMGGTTMPPSGPANTPQGQTSNIPIGAQIPRDMANELMPMLNAHGLDVGPDGRVRTMLVGEQVPALGAQAMMGEQQPAPAKLPAGSQTQLPGEVQKPAQPVEEVGPKVVGFAHHEGQLKPVYQVGGQEASEAQPSAELTPEQRGNIVGALGFESRGETDMAKGTPAEGTGDFNIHWIHDPITGSTGAMKTKDMTSPEAVHDHVINWRRTQIADKNYVIGGRMMENARAQATSDPQSAYRIAGAGYLEGGVKDFNKWSQAMKEDFGQAVTPHLEAVWKGLQSFDGGTPEVAATQLFSPKIEDDKLAFSAHDEGLGIDSNQAGVVALGPNGNAEPAVMSAIKGEVDPDTMAYSLASKGQEGGHAGMLGFTEDADGPDGLYSFTVPEEKAGRDEVAKALQDAGIKYATIAPVKDGNVAIIYSQGRAHEAAITQAGKAVGADAIEFTPGHGTVIRGDNSESAGRKYTRAIQDFQSRHASGEPAAPENGDAGNVVPNPNGGHAENADLGARPAASEQPQGVAAPGEGVGVGPLAQRPEEAQGPTSPTGPAGPAQGGIPKWASSLSKDEADAALAARDRFRSKMLRSHFGADPTMLADLAEYGWYRAKAGLRDFNEWSDAMLKDFKDFGDRIRPHLEAAWKRIQNGEAIEKTPTPFYSQSEEVVKLKMGNSASGEQVLKMLKNPELGISPEEITWSGIEDFLKDKPKVSKSEVLDYLQRNNFKVREEDQTSEDSYEPSDDEIRERAEELARQAARSNGPDEYDVKERAKELAERARQEALEDFDPEPGTDYETPHIFVTQNEDGTWSARIGDEDADPVEGRYSPATALSGRGQGEFFTDLFRRGQTTNRFPTEEEARQAAYDSDEYEREEQHARDRAYEDFDPDIDWRDYVNDARDELSEGMESDAGDYYWQDFQDDAERQLREEHEDDESGLQYGEYSLGDEPGPNAHELLFYPDTPRPIGQYRAPHFGSEKARNLMFHVRWDERKTADGKPVMVIQEIQSDLHQAGRKTGYDTPERRAIRAQQEEELNRAYDESKRTSYARDVAYQQLNDLRNKLAQDIGLAYFDEINDAPTAATKASRIKYAEGNFNDAVANYQWAINPDSNSSWGPANRHSSLYRERMVDAGKTLDITKQLQTREDLQKKFDEAHKGNAELSELERRHNDLERENSDAYERYLQARHVIDHNERLIPDVPFKKTDQWAGVAMRRALRYAAENGYDQMAWTRGVDQVERYHNAIRRRVDNIAYEREGDFVQIRATKNDNPVFVEKVPLQGKTEVQGYDVDLDDVVGEHIAKQIRSGPEKGEIKGDELTIGGKGMQGFYDKIMPEYLNRFAKRFGAKAGTMQILVHGDPVTVNYIPVTQEMRDSVLYEGQPLFGGRSLRPERTVAAKQKLQSTLRGPAALTGGK